MNSKQMMQTMFALCASAILTTGCSNDELISPKGESGSGNGETSVTFSLGLPQGDEVGYTRAADATIADDETENTMKSLKVYHFHAKVDAAADEPADNAYQLVRIYNVPITTSAATNGESPTTAGTCINNGNGTYSVKLSLRTNAITETDKHAFAFIANDSCSAFDANSMAEGTTLEQLHKQLADKQVTGGTASADLFMGDPAGLCMTGEVKNKTLTSGSNKLSEDADKTPLTRIMARLDVKNFVPKDRDFKIESVRLLYSEFYTAPKGYLFDIEGQDYIWNTPEKEMEITQNPVYDTYGYLPYANYSAASGMKDTWVATTVNKREGVWYKKVLYMYEFPVKNGAGSSTNIPPIQIKVKYTLNGVSATTTLKIVDPLTSVPYAITRNTVYTLQVGETESQGGGLTFNFVFTPWTAHDVDVDLSEGTEVVTPAP